MDNEQVQAWADRHEIKLTGADLRAAFDDAVTLSTAPALTVWYGPMPESNGKSNFTAILMHKGGGIVDGWTIDRSEYPDRVRYEADRVRWLIGELKERPDILAYDADKHSGYVAPPSPFDSQPIEVERAAVPLTGAQCDEFRRHSGDFNDMLRAVYEAGRASAQCAANIAFGTHYRRRYDAAVASLVEDYRSNPGQVQVSVIGSNHYLLMRAIDRAVNLCRVGGGNLDGKMYSLFAPYVVTPEAPNDPR